MSSAKRLVLLVLNFVLVSCTAPEKSMESFEQKAEALFAIEFEKNTIKGHGHIFWIALECDQARLKAIQNSLKDSQIKQILYRFKFSVNTKDKSKTWITGKDLSKDVNNCIIKKYHTQVFFTPFSPEVMDMDIAFPVLLKKGEDPIAPTTPVGFIGSVD